MLNFLINILSNNTYKINIEAIGNKSLFSIYASLFAYLYSSFDEIIAIYTVLILIDYILGMIFSMKNKTFCIKKGFLGAVNKLLCFTVIIVAMLLDYLMMHLSNKYGIDIKINYIAILTSIFLIVNEGSSIIRNWKCLGIETPFYLKGVFDFLKNIKNINKK
jgi:toxin secretion/phage lysis holin